MKRTSARPAGVRLSRQPSWHVFSSSWLSAAVAGLQLLKPMQEIYESVFALPKRLNTNYLHI